MVKDRVNDFFNFRIFAQNDPSKERFRSLRTPFYRGADCGILVYSKNDAKVILAFMFSEITHNFQSLENITYWKSEFYKHAPEEAPVILARNKVDIGGEGDDTGPKWRGDDLEVLLDF